MKHKILIAGAGAAIFVLTVLIAGAPCNSDEDETGVSEIRERLKKIASIEGREEFLRAYYSLLKSNGLDVAVKHGDRYVFNKCFVMDLGNGDLEVRPMDGGDASSVFANDETAVIAIRAGKVSSWKDDRLSGDAIVLVKSDGFLVTISPKSRSVMFLER